MCHDLDSLPPIEPIAGAAIAHRDLTLAAADGARLAAFEARADEPSGACVAVLPDVRGLYRFYEELALRLAENGHTAVVIDYFGRTAGVAKRDDDFDYREHVRQATEEGLQADVAAAVAHLRSLGDCARIFTVGFCFGGRRSWLAATNPANDLAGAVGFYGIPGERDGVPGPTQRAGEIRAPVLALMGGADHATSAVDVAEFEAALAGAGVEHEVVTYEGAPHSFFDRKQEEFADASADAWRRTLEFIDRRTGRDYSV